MEGRNTDYLSDIFATLRKKLTIYQPPLNNKVDLADRYELWTEKAILINGRRHTEMFFAALIIQKNYVGFYLMPLYVEPSFKGCIAPELLKLLKGKTCFHIKVFDNQIFAQIEVVLEQGFILYQQRNWI